LVRTKGREGIIVKEERERIQTQGSKEKGICLIKITDARAILSDFRINYNAIRLVVGGEASGKEWGRQKNELSITGKTIQ